MKKFTAGILILVLALSICACGRMNSTETTIPTVPGTTMDILPSIDVTIDTNIPDPNVNSTMPMYTDGTNATENQSESNDTTAQQGKTN